MNTKPEEQWAGEEKNSIRLDRLDTCFVPIGNSSAARIPIRIVIAISYKARTNQLLISCDTLNTPFSVATWNARTWYLTGKFENVKQEMKRMNLSILGNTWKKSDVITFEEGKLIYLLWSLAVIQVYAPMIESSEEDLNAFYSNLNDALKTCKSQEVVIMIGDLNAKVGSEKIRGVVGPHGIGERN
ncbi:hypothetical protein HELRODRAFT_183142 [Helobdella robusta]|uniref:Endonuclease/exonuclease/phosphatase domain-containing protein n=1 Tax=Helobdella robusta TaxID=6412 RepID=T1FJ72_HELRO|nr:hypothetical protein HELRODRAFT_183142 [Helobdella robusta]ESO11449.1 hypothetical protein HELRODRAFT_183142 [Helobdella robusta]